MSAGNKYPSKLANILLCTVGILMFTHAGAATAKSGLEERRSRIVKIGDLDLNSEKGLRTYRSRIHRAARLVCMPAGNSSPLFARCVQEAKRNVRPRARVDCRPADGADGMLACTTRPSYAQRAPFAPGN
jgi:UrcA family protein